mmetsp:Transcript_17245/g.42785  ORF Transcript_17245/g.42785 Transcript_17245/m.42785 type:complete len:665 (-) Transcript_17245:1904-3898(-)
MADDIDLEVLNDDIELLLQQLQEELQAKADSDDFRPDYGDLIASWGMCKHGDPNAISTLYSCLEFAICGTDVENFDSYETCFGVLTKVGMYLGMESTQEHLVMLLMNINEIYDVLLNCVETYEWVQPGVTGLLRMYMLQTLFSVVGYDAVTGKHLMELTNNDVAGAVSLVCFVIRCGECSFQLQEAAARCLVDLTTADAVFFRDEKLDEDYNSQDIAKLTGMLNKHVNGLIMSIIEFELVDAFGRCICQHQQSHLRTDIIIRFFLTALHNCLLYCSENQKKLRMHLATQSTIIQDIMFPYVDNILPALYENTRLGLDAIEYQNLKATLQTFVVITFNINVFRQHFLETDFLLRVLEAPLVPSSVPHMELVFKILVNADVSKARFKDELVAVVENAFAQLDEVKQARLYRKVVESGGGHSLPLSRANVKAMQLMPFLFGEVADIAEGGAGGMGRGTDEDGEEGRGRSKWRRKGKRTRKRGKYGLQWVRKKEKDGMIDSEEESDTEELDEGGAGAENAPEGQEMVPESGAEGLCQLSGAFMTDPVKTPYGHVFDRQALSDWLQFSATDPICGQPLTMDDCVPYTELQAKIFEEQLGQFAGQVLNTEYNSAEVAQAQEALTAEQGAEGAGFDQAGLGDLPSLEADKKEKKDKKKGIFTDTMIQKLAQ